MGILITYGSYVSRKNSVAGGAKMVAFVDTSVAFFAGLLILPAIFAFTPEILGDDASSSSVSLVFVFLPKIFLALEGLVGFVTASLVASTFFLLVFFAAITSQVSILQVPISALQDELKFSRIKSVLTLGALAAVLVIGSVMSFGMVDWLTDLLRYGKDLDAPKSLFDLIYDVFYETILPLNGLVVCLFVVYRWKRANMNDELKTGDDSFDGSFAKRYISIALGTFVPAILAFVFISTVLLKFFGISVI